MKNILSYIRQYPLAQRVALCAILPAMVVMPEQVRANPSGGVVVHGAAEINADIEGHLQIFQTSNKAIINWENFSIGEGELTQFIQPGANASALSRVVSGNPSAIMGTLRANGGHMLINQNGIVVGANGVVDVAGMNVLSTMDVSNDQFLAGGDMVFTGATAAGVTNFGTISSSEGDVILLGNFVDNQGSIGAVNGTVALGAGGSILLSSGGGDSTISIQGAGAGGNTGVSNSGAITAAAVELKSHGNVYALAINNTGTVRATGFNRANGRVTLSAGEPGGSIVNTGSIRANNADGSGGIIDINAGPEGSVDLQAGEVVANGGSGAGGSISVTGMTVNVGEGVQVTANGDTGGSVTVGSADFTTAVTTEANSVISASGAGGQGGTVAVLGTADSVMTLAGRIAADGADGGSITVTGGNITQTETGVFSANGENNGGVISVNGAEVVLSGLNEVNGVNGNGGAFQANATENLTVTETGVINANGAENGGMISVGAGGDLQFDGTANANGENGNGGVIEATADGDLSVGPTGALNANGGEAGGTINMSAGGDLAFDGAASANGINGEGGRILADAGGTNTINGTLSATSENGIGGRIAATGEEVFVGPNASLDATGALGGGAIFAGGDFQGNEGGLREAQSTTVAAGAQFRANSTVGGNGGTVVVWADGDTFFEGAITAQALGATGNGGLIEVSGAEKLSFRGDVSATSVGGSSGTVLFDPGDVSVGNGASDIPIASVNTILQGGTSVIISTESGNITFENLGLGNNRNFAIQWTNSNASFGAFASDNIFVNNHIRTSGGGSINLMAGWGGSEADFGVVTGVTSYFDNLVEAPTGGSLFASNSGLSDVEAVWESYLEQGLFGDNGTVFIGGSDLNRSINVGSRFGNTNVAASNLIMTTLQDFDGGESDWVHLGFRDTGKVFSVRTNGTGFSNAGLDLNDRTLEVDNDVIVGMLPLLADGTLDLASPLLVDLNSDTVPDGVYAVNSNGILDADNIATGGLADGSDAGNATFIPFANNFMSERFGNWWWQQIDGRDEDPQGLGGLLPEHGAGTSVTDRADINVATTGAVLMNGGGRNQNYAQIGHGGDSTAWGDDRGLANGNAATNLSNQSGRNVTYNNAQNDRSGNSIARLAGVFGNINVLAGLDASTVQYDRNALTGNLTGTVDSQGGVVRLEGWQDVEDLARGTNNGNDTNFNQSSDAYVQIGHLGNGQFGSVTGDITVRAGGDIDILAGAHTRGHASIGHTMNGLAYWNPSSDPAQQVRFFANSGDLANPNLRKGELFQNTNTGVGPGRGFYQEGVSGGDHDNDFYGQPAQLGTLAQHPDGVIGVAAMTGAVRTDLIGDITVTSGGPNGVTLKGFTNPDTRTQTSTDDLTTIGDLDGDGDSAQLNNVDDNDDRDGLVDNRDRRFAVIGHGGSNNAVDRENSNDLVQLRANARTTAGGDDALASGTGELGTVGTAVNRSQTNVNIQGDIVVTTTRGGVTLQAGNDTFDHAAIGHGGPSLGDYESSGQIVGNITVSSVGDVLLEGGAVQADFTGSDDRDFFSHASIGHHGRESGSQYYAGDISVISNGDITLRGGRYRESGAKIGHQSATAYGQVGGEFIRNENMVVSNVGLEGASIDSEQQVTATESIFRVDLNGDGDFDDTDETKTFAHSGYTANVTVEAGANGNAGSVLLTHAKPGGLLNQNQYAFNNDGNRNDIRFSSVQIGHGGRETAALRNNGTNDGYNYSAKIGDVNVTAGGVAVADATTGVITTTGGNITLQNGEGPQGWWTTIGHALGNSGRDRAGGPDDLNNSYVMGGNININAFGNLLLDATFANETDTINLNGPGLPQVVGAPADQNHVQIGHGGGYDGLDVVVLDTGDFKGITMSSDIDVEVGNDLDINGGNGTIDSHAQIGHGFTSDAGNDASRPAGFNGDITVNVGNSMTLTGSPNAAVQLPGLTSEALPVEGAAAVVGHGGHQLDASLSGNISVYVGDRTIYNGDEADFVGNLTLQGSQRTELVGTNGNPLTDTSSNPLGSAFNFAKIGHWQTELQGAGGRGPVDGDAIGDITVVVANDLNMNGGTTPDYTNAPVVFAYAQIGNGGPGVNGAKTGDITVVVGNDFTTLDGTSQLNSPGAINSNNYVMVGHGDWVRDGSTFAVPATGGQGRRSGNISVAVGHSANLQHTLIGHADPAILTGATTILDGDTFFGISRDFPFFGNNPTIPTSDGTLTTSNDTVFSSAFYGLGSELRIYMPQREDNNINNTRLNSRTVSYNSADTDASFADSKGSIFDTSRGELAGRDDEVYLQPDLFWDDEDISSLANSETFPQTLAAGTGGGISTVNAPGGFPNLVSLSAGAFGSGSTTYRGGNAVVGVGQYTFYYDAIQPVASVVGVPGSPGGGGAAPVVIPPVIFVPPVVIEEPVPVVITPFNFLPFLFIDKFDSFDRDDMGLDGGQTSLFDGLGIFGFLRDGEDEEGLKDGDPISNLLGFNSEDEEETAGDTEEERRRNTRNRLLGKIGNIYYVYDVNAGEYSSFREFGLPASLLIE